MDGAVALFNLREPRAAQGNLEIDPARTRVACGAAAVAEIAPSWELLRERLGSRQIRHDPAWLRVQAETGGGSGDPRFTKQGSEPMVTTLLDDAGNLVAVAPLLVHPWRWRARIGYATIASFPVRRAILCGDAPLGSDDVGTAEQLLAATLCTPDAYDLIALESLPVGGALWRAIHESGWIRENFWVRIPKAQSSHRIIRLPATFAAYLAKFSGRTRRTLAYKARKLDEHSGGAITVKRFRRRDELGEFLDVAERVSARSWQGTRLGQVFRRDVQEARLRAFADLGWVRSYVLYAGEEPIAFVAGTQAHGVYHYDHASYDPGWAAHHPGTVLLYRLIEDLLAEDRPDVVDFGYGDNEYKRLFANEAYDEVNAMLVRKSTYMAVALAADRACVGASKAVRGTLDRFQLREKVRHLLRGRAKAEAGGPAARGVGQ